jgi:biopolymer transport protein ExbD
VRLPLAPAALPGSDLTFDRLSVVLDARGRLQVDGRWLDEEAAAAWWAQQAKARKAGLEALGDRGAAAEELPTVVIVRADRAASYGAVRRTLATAQEQGFAHFSLVVLRRRER